MTSPDDSVRGLQRSWAERRRDGTGLLVSGGLFAAYASVNAILAGLDPRCPPPDPADDGDGPASGLCGLAGITGPIAGTAGAVATLMLAFGGRRRAAFNERRFGLRSRQWSNHFVIGGAVAYERQKRHRRGRSDRSQSEQGRAGR